MGEENTDMVGQLDINKRDALCYRNQCDSLLVENKKFKRMIKKREQETDDLTDQIARYVNQFLQNLDTSSDNLHNISFSSSSINQLPDIFQIQKVISDNVLLQRKIEDYN